MNTQPFPGTEQVNPATVFSGPGYNAPRRNVPPVAILALVVALASPLSALLAVALTSTPIATMVAPLLATGLAWIAREQARKPGNGGAAMSQFTLVISLTMTTLALMASIVYLNVIS
ncbi:MAG: hypothetical protein Q3999_00100 [Buchananella hordeovulneris]|nr:hypothetical protein [Buchananella hordeovulneris]